MSGAGRSGERRAATEAAAMTMSPRAREAQLVSLIACSARALQQRRTARRNRDAEDVVQLRQDHQPADAARKTGYDRQRDAADVLAKPHHAKNHHEDGGNDGDFGGAPEPLLVHAYWGHG